MCEQPVNVQNEYPKVEQVWNWSRTQDDGCCYPNIAHLRLKPAIQGDLL